MLCLYITTPFSNCQQLFANFFEIILKYFSKEKTLTLRKTKSFLSQLFDFAVMNEIISKDKHVVEYPDIGKNTQSTKHYKFNSTEIDALWNWSVNEYVQIILMLIYSGVRPGELLALKKTNVNLTEE